MAVRRVLRTEDRRWRLEVRGDGRVDLLMAGMLVAQGTSMQQARQRLVDAGVDPDGMVED